MIHGGEIYDKEIDLDFSVNLNPYPCPKSVIEAVRAAASDVARYPDLEQRKYRDAVCRAENACLKGKFTPDNIIGGNGASEILSCLVNMLRPKRVLLPVPCFYGYVHALEMADGCEINEFPLDCHNGFVLTEDFAERITEDTDLVILGNPNNPTGRCVDRNVLERVIDRCRDTNTSLIVDECFIRLTTTESFGRECVSARQYIGTFDKLFVVDAYTKLFSIPGVRVGFALSGAENIKRLQKFLPEWNMSVFAQSAGIACADIIADSSFVGKSSDIILREKKFMSENLRLMGIEVYESDANFFLVRAGRRLGKRLLDNGILVRDCSNFKGLDDNYFRIALKDRVSNGILLRMIKEIQEAL